MLAIALAALAWLGLIYAPGLALCYALRPAGGLVRNAALGAPVGIGLTMVIGQAMEVVGIAIRPLTALPVSIGITALICVPAMRRAFRSGDRPHFRRPVLPDYLLVLAIVAGLATWVLGVPSISSVLPSTDGAHHGLYAHRILSLQTLDPRVVVAGDQASGTPTWNYYPLAIHLCAALISGATGVAVNTVLTVGMVASAAVVLPVGIFALSRRVLPGRDDVAGIAAVVSATFAWFPFAPVLWGGLPTIIAMTQVPAATDALWRKPDDGSGLAVGVLVAIAMAGIVQEHSTEAVAVVLFALILTAAGWRAMPSSERRLNRDTWAVAIIAGAVLLASSIPMLARGLGERVDYLGGGTAVLSDGGWLYTIGNPVVAGFALVGLALALRRPRLMPFLGCLAASAALFGVAFIDSPITRALTVPWYSSPARVSYLIAYFEAILAAIAIAEVLSRLRGRALDDVRRHTSQLAAGAGVIALGTLIILPASFESAAFVRAAYDGGSRVGPDQRAGFAWLARHVTASDRVLNEFVDGSGWMETLDGVHPVFATDPETLPVVDPQTQWGDRWYLLTHASRLATDTRAQAAARRWNVHYVYVNARVIGHSYPSRLSATRLESSPAYTEVWRRGDVTIFRVSRQVAS